MSYNNVIFRLWACFCRLKWKFSHKKGIKVSLIKESDAPYILNECEVLVNGSISSVCEGKNYKRAKMMHEFLALALLSLHFEQFTKSQEDDVLHTLKTEMAKFRPIGKAELSKEVLELYDEYTKYICDSKDSLVY